MMVAGVDPTRYTEDHIDERRAVVCLLSRPDVLTIRAIRENEA